MKAFIILAALFVISAAMPAEEPKPEEAPKQKRGLFEFEHAPTFVHAAPVVAKSYSTPIIHAGPVVTKVFDAPPAPYFKGYGEPLITGPLITKGFGPHIYGAKTIYHSPIIKTAPIYTAPIYAKPIYQAPFFSYAPKLTAPIAYGHGW